MFEQLPNTPDDMKNSVVGEVVSSLKLKTFGDNFDKERFNYDGIDRSNIFDISERVFWFSWFYDNYLKLYDALIILNNERSKRLFLNIIAYRMAGHHSVKINTLFNENGPQYEAFLKCVSGNKSKLPACEMFDSGMFGPLTHYDFIYEGKRYKVDCTGLKNYLFRRQYCYNEGSVSIQPSVGDYVVDAGACLGDTAVIFGKAVGPEGKVFSFEPVANHLEVLEYNINQNVDCNIVAIPFGLSNRDVIAPPIKLDTYNPGFGSRNDDIPVRALDSLVMDGVIPRVDFIKMDIEGAELAALEGATGCIQKYRPKLAISLYHKPNDLFEIPAYLHRRFPFYEMYIEHYTIHNEETVLYCNPRN